MFTSTLGCLSRILQSGGMAMGEGMPRLGVPVVCVHWVCVYLVCVCVYVYPGVMCGYLVCFGGR